MGLNKDVLAQGLLNMGNTMTNIMMSDIAAQKKAAMQERLLGIENTYATQRQTADFAGRQALLASENQYNSDLVDKENAARIAQIKAQGGQDRQTLGYAREQDELLAQSKADIERETARLGQYSAAVADQVENLKTNVTNLLTMGETITSADRDKMDDEMREQFNQWIASTQTAMENVDRMLASAVTTATYNLDESYKAKVDAGEKPSPEETNAHKRVEALKTSKAKNDVSKLKLGFVVSDIEKENIKEQLGPSALDSAVKAFEKGRSQRRYDKTEAKRVSAAISDVGKNVESTVKILGPELDESQPSANVAGQKARLGIGKGLESVARGAGFINEQDNYVNPLAVGATGVGKGMYGAGLLAERAGQTVQGFLGQQTGSRGGIEQVNATTFDEAQTQGLRIMSQVRGGAMPIATAKSEINALIQSSSNQAVRTYLENMVRQLEQME